MPSILLPTPEQRKEMQTIERAVVRLEEATQAFNQLLTDLEGNAQ